MNPVRVVVAGSRDFEDYALLEKELNLFLGDFDKPDLEIVSGHARGADQLGEKYARRKKIRLTLFKADWEKEGPSAGVRRNNAMARYATHAIVFWDGLSRGSAHMIQSALDHKLELRVVRFK